jgi:predicted metal-dependent hydrolase
VAHLREMNHGPRFWRLVLTHCPESRVAKQWIKKNGQSLHRFG